jgi:23S rRNA pseudouridine1911/1915/1917 synthase
LSRAGAQRLIKAGRVTRDGKAATDADRRVWAGETYEITLPPPEPAAPKAQALPLTIVYGDDDLLVIDKPAGLVVHPAAGNRDGTLVNALLAHCGASLSGIGGVARPGIVHRLDKDTSGLMVVAKHDAAHRALSAQFADRSLSRVYQAVTRGVPHPAKGSIEGAIGRHPRDRKRMAVVARGGKPALTHYKVMERFGTEAGLVECRLATGRTHQIRAHMAHIKHPLIGDPVYGARRGGIVFPRQALHAAELTFLHPRTGRAMKFRSPLPEDMAGLLAALRGKGQPAAASAR